MIRFVIVVFSCVCLFENAYEASHEAHVLIHVNDSLIFAGNTKNYYFYYEEKEKNKVSVTIN